MARTRGISAGVNHADDGELLDKEGKPIPTVAHQTWTGVAQQPNPDVAPVAPPVEAEPPPDPRYHCDATTLGRDMDGYEAFRLVDLLVGGLSADIDGEAWSRLPADVRRHFRRVA